MRAGQPRTHEMDSRATGARTRGKGRGRPRSIFGPELDFEGFDDSECTDELPPQFVGSTDVVRMVRVEGERKSSTTTEHTSAVVTMTWFTRLCSNFVVTIRGHLRFVDTRTS